MSSVSVGPTYSKSAKNEAHFIHICGTLHSDGLDRLSLEVTDNHFIYLFCALHYTLLGSTHRYKSKSVHSQ